MTETNMNIPLILEQHRLWLNDAGGSRADLSGANLRGANLRGANLRSADLCDADLVDGGQRSDGYRFVGSVRDGKLMITAGCRYVSIEDGRVHWRVTRGGTRLGAETMCILDHIESVAIIRGLYVALPAASPAA